MAKYRMIACCVGDYEAAEMTIDKIEALDEFDQEYFIIEESDSLDDLRAEAVSICNDWWNSQFEEADDLYDDERRKELEDYRRDEEKTLSKLEVGHTSKSVCSTNDWIRIEEA